MYKFIWDNKADAIDSAWEPSTKRLLLNRSKSKAPELTSNVYIEGDNLDALKLIKKEYQNKIKVIYIDPPYNTGNKFIYDDNFAKPKTKDETQSWKHINWLNMMYPRLLLGRELLRDDGVIYISIDDNEVAQLKMIMDEIFHGKNFVAQLIQQRAKGGGRAKHVVRGHDYILVYAKDISKLHLQQNKTVKKQIITKNGIEYFVDDDVVRKTFGKYDKSKDRRCFYEEILTYKDEATKKRIDKKIADGTYFLKLNKFGLHTICQYKKVSEATSKIYSILKLDESTIIKALSEEGKKDLESLQVEGFDYPKPVSLVKKLIDACATKSNNDLILDFFSGSGTTAQAVIELNNNDGGNRKFILVQIPENGICDLARDRIDKAGFGLSGDVGFKVFECVDA